MKKITLFLSILAVIFSSCQDKNAFTIEGNFSENTYDGKMVYLQKMDTTEQMMPIAIDSAKIAEGKFTFKGKLTESPSMGFISVGKLQDRGKSGEPDNSPVGTIILEPGNINIVFNKTSVTLSGTPQNEEFNKVHSILNQISDLYVEASKQAESGNEQALTEISAKLEPLQKEMQTVTFDFAKTNMKNRVGEFLFISSGNTFTNDQLLELINLSDSTFSNKPQIQDLYKRLSVKIPKEGDAITDVSLTDQNGNPVMLSAYVPKGKVVLIDFWASWCAPCIKEMPNLVKAYNTYKAKGFEIVGISVDEDDDAWEKAIKANNMSWTQLIDANGTAANIYGVQSIPHTLLVDQNGTIVATQLRGGALEAKLAELLK